MNKIDFLEFYNGVVKKLGVHLENEYRQFHFCDNPDSLYEEYLNQKTMLRVLYQKKNGESKTLLDRHKVCACMTAAIIKVNHGICGKILRNKQNMTNMDILMYSAVIQKRLTG